MQVIRMPYRGYKLHYADCATVRGSYDAVTKSIEVEIPEGRQKPSGTRGRTFRYYRFTGRRADGSLATTTIKATCVENARRYLSRDVTWDD